MTKRHDHLSPAERSALMSKIRGKNTGPERLVRAIVRRLGFAKRYRCNVRRLPGCPDLVFGFLKKAIFVHGCFWHDHNCSRRRLPVGNKAYWIGKFKRNKKRDAANLKQIRDLGWKVLVVWECELNRPSLSRRLTRFLGQ